jgi:hypothetical protein
LKCVLFGRLSVATCVLLLIRPFAFAQYDWVSFCPDLQPSTFQFETHSRTDSNVILNLFFWLCVYQGILQYDFPVLTLLVYLFFFNITARYGVNFHTYLR